MSSDTYIHITKVGQFLKKASERRVFFAWSLATHLAKGQTFVDKELLISELKSRNSYFNWEKTIDNCMIPFFREGGGRLYFVKQETWLTYLMTRSNVKYHKFPRQIRHSSELANLKTFVYNMVRACAENPIKKKGKMFTKGRGKEENKQHMILGRGIDTVAKQCGLNRNYVCNILSMFEGGGKLHNTIRRYYVSGEHKKLADAVTAVRHANSLGDGRSFIKRKRNKYVTCKKLSNAYMFTGLRFSRSFNISITDEEETLHDNTDAVPTTTPTDSIRKKYSKLKTSQGVSSINRIVQEQKRDFEVPFYKAVSNTIASLNMRSESIPMSCLSETGLEVLSSPI